MKLSQIVILSRPRMWISKLDTFPVAEDLLEPSPWASALQKTFATDAPLPQRARACREACPNSPLKDRLHLFVAEQFESHARGIEIQIRRWLQDGHRNIGLVTEDRKLARRVRALVERAGITFQDFSGWALSTTSAAGVIIRWLECLNPELRFHHLALMDVLKSPFIRLTETPDYLKLIQEFEQAARANNICFGLDNYKRLARKKERQDWLDLIEAVERAAKPLGSLAEHTTGAQYLGALLESLKFLDCHDRLAMDEVGLRILERLETAVFELKHNDSKMPHSQWVALLRHILESRNFQPPSRQKTVSLLSLTQAHLAHYDRLIVASMDVRHYPRPAGTSLVLNDSVLGDFGLPIHAEERELGLQRFLSLVMSADEVLLTRQKADQDDPLLPGAWWTQIEVFHQLAYEKTSLEHHDLGLLSFEPKAWVHFPKPPMREAPAVGQDSDMLAHPRAMPELVPDRISASGHQTLIDCPYRFYARYMLRLREPEVPREEMDAVEYGSFVHLCLQAFHSDIAEAPGPWKGTVGERREDAARLLQEIGQHFIQQFTSSPSSIVFEQRWEKTIEQYVRMQSETEEVRSVLDCEKCIDREIDGGPALRGMIDRIDEIKDGGKVLLDYKTTSGKISIKDIENGEKVQLTTYAALLPEVSQAEYWWLSPNHANTNPLTSFVNEDLESTRDRVIERLCDLFRCLHESAELPANGDARTCGYCYAQGVCRKDVEGSS